MISANLDIESYKAMAQNLINRINDNHISTSHHGDLYQMRIILFLMYCVVLNEELEKINKKINYILDEVLPQCKKL